MGNESQLFMNKFKSVLKENQTNFTKAVDFLNAQNLQLLGELQPEDFHFLKKVLEKLKTKKVDPESWKKAMYKLNLVEKQFGKKKVAFDDERGEHDDWEELLKMAKEKKAEVVYLKSGKVPFFKIGGVLTPIEDEPKFTATGLKNLIYNMFTPTHFNEFMDDKRVDFSLSIPGVSRFRVSAFWETEGPALTFKQIPFDSPTLEGVKLDEETLKNIMQSRGGVILVCGPAVSGKSTTCAAILSFINQNYQKRIVTLESPIEFLFRDNQSAMCQREVGSDFEKIEDGLRTSLQDGADVIFLSEIRSSHELEWALSAAETNHVVLASVPAKDSIQAMEWLSNLGGSEAKSMMGERLSKSLLMITAQVLCPGSRGGLTPVRELIVFDVNARAQLQENKMQVLKNLMDDPNNSDWMSFHKSFAEGIKNQELDYQAVKEQISDRERFESRYKNLIG
jgi:pilus retraction protein PilT